MSGPPEWSVKPCEACGELIFFGLTPKPARMPLNAKPKKLWRILPLLPGERIDQKVEQVEVYEPHWSTCTKPDQFRKERG